MAKIIEQPLASLYIAYSLLQITVDGAHVYGIPNMNFYSHSQVLLKLGKELVKRGHKYTQVIPDVSRREKFPEDINTLTYKSSVSPEQIESMMAKLAQAGEKMNLFFQAAFETRNISISMAEDLINNKRIMEEINSTASLLVCDLTNVLCPVLADIFHKVRVDVVPVSSFEPFGSFYYGQPQILVTMPPLPSLTYLDVSFLGRLKNTLIVPLWYFMLTTTMSMEQIWQKFEQHKSSSYQAAIRSASMVLVSNDFATEFPRALPAHMKVVGPILPEPPKALPLSFQTFLDESTNILVVSFGTVLSAYSEELTQALADGLAQLPVKVLWKHADKLPERIGNNTTIFPDIPQNDILGHRNVKAFFTHGGGNSFFESVYHAVPMVCMPLLGDQYRNAAIIKEKNIGILLFKDGITSEAVTNSITQVLENPQYANNIKKISRIIKDRKNTPAEEGADWIEYVLRHDGASHLKNPLIDLPFYQEYMLDVFLFIGFILGLSLYLVCKFCSFIFRKCICSRFKKGKKEKVK